MKKAQLTEVCQAIQPVLCYFGEQWEDYLTPVVANVTNIFRIIDKGYQIDNAAVTKELATMMGQKTWSETANIKPAKKKPGRPKKQVSSEDFNAGVNVEIPVESMKVENLLDKDPPTK